MRVHAEVPCGSRLHSSRQSFGGEGCVVLWVQEPAPRSRISWRGGAGCLWLGAALGGGA
jgi:hypothetical protein